MKNILSITHAVFFNFVMGAAIATAVGFDAFAGGGVATAIGFIPFSQFLPSNMLFVGVLKEIWTGEVIKKFRHEGTFLQVIQGRDDLVDNDVIHLVDAGADPEVLINNTTYPIAIVDQEDADVPISLDKFDTENTRVKDDELYAISYDKIGLVIDNHVKALQEKTLEKALHALAPASDTASTPVLDTTGAVVDGRLRATAADFIKMKRKFDDLKVPKADRHVVLCNEHIEDVLSFDETFANQYKNIREGQVLKLFGFTVHELSYSPVYHDTNKTKAAFGAAPAGTDSNASVFFYAPRVFKATGSTKMYYREAANDPENRQNVIGFTQRFICLPKKIIGFGALKSKQD